MYRISNFNTLIILSIERFYDIKDNTDDALNTITVVGSQRSLHDQTIFDD